MIGLALYVLINLDEQTQGITAQNPASPLPPSLESLVAIGKRVSGPPDGGSSSVWRQSQATWATVWRHENFGVGKLVEDSSRFRFRVPPDADLKQVGGKEPYLVESYQNGLPLLGIRRRESGDPARPLGFRYGTDGLCSNLRVRVLEKNRWRGLRLSKRETTIMGRFMAANEYAAGVAEVAPPRFGTPWLRITAEGYGDYWIDHELVCVGPFGAEGRLLRDVASNIQDLIDGGYSGRVATDRKRT